MIKKKNILGDIRMDNENISSIGFENSSSNLLMRQPAELSIGTTSCEKPMNEMCILENCSIPAALEDPVHNDNNNSLIKKVPI